MCKAFLSNKPDFVCTATEASSIAAYSSVSVAPGPCGFTSDQSFGLCYTDVRRLRGAPESLKSPSIATASDQESAAKIFTGGALAMGGGWVSRDAGDRKNSIRRDFVRS